VMNSQRRSQFAVHLSSVTFVFLGQEAVANILATRVVFVVPGGIVS
jgi:hypothetical protein